MLFYNVKITDEAERDLEQIFDHLFDDCKYFSFCYEFVNNLKGEIKKSLSFSPEKHVIYKANIRKFVSTSHKNYIALFEINESQQEVAIYAITNSAQQTRYLYLT